MSLKIPAAANNVVIPLQGNISSTTTVLYIYDNFDKLPQQAPFRAVWWNASSYPNPWEDPNVEIVECVKVYPSQSAIKIRRGMEGTVPSPKGYDSKLMVALTAGTLEEIQNALVMMAKVSLGMDPRITMTLFGIPGRQQLKISGYYNLKEAVFTGRYIYCVADASASSGPDGILGIDLLSDNVNWFPNTDYSNGWRFSNLCYAGESRDLMFLKINQSTQDIKVCRLEQHTGELAISPDTVYQASAGNVSMAATLTKAFLFVHSSDEYYEVHSVDPEEDQNGLPNVEYITNGSLSTSTYTIAGSTRLTGDSILVTIGGLNKYFKIQESSVTEYTVSGIVGFLGKPFVWNGFLYSLANVSGTRKLIRIVPGETTFTEVSSAVKATDDPWIAWTHGYYWTKNASSQTTRIRLFSGTSESVDNSWLSIDTLVGASPFLLMHRATDGETLLMKPR